MSPESIRERMASILPPEALLPEEALGAWPEDVPPPAACLAPATEEEVATVLREATARKWRVLPAGAGSWIQGWGTPDVDLVVSTRRLDGMRIYEPADLTLTTGAGMLFQTLQEATEANGQWLPLDPPGARRGTLGALVANGVPGPLREAYGAPRDHILGLTMISGDGRILRWGGRVVKNVAGFDVTRLSIGSRGALGIITSVSARLFPIPREDRTLVLGGESAQALLPLARELGFSSMPLSAIELLEPGLGERSGAELMVRLMGTEGQLGEMEARVADFAGKAGCRNFSRVAGEESRSLHAGLEDWEEGASLVLRLSLLPTRMASLLEWSQTLPQTLALGGGSQMARAAHAGWGVLRLAFRGPSPGEAGWKAAARPLLDLRERLEREGGSLTVSQGPRALLGEMAREGQGGSVTALIRGLKKTFDPAGILVPGRLDI